MQYNPLGKTDLRVSRLCLGCMTFGEPDRGNHAWTLPEESSRPIIKRALEGGINFFDTANSRHTASMPCPLYNHCTALNVPSRTSCFGTGL